MQQSTRLSFEGAIADVPSSIIILDGNGVFQYVNKAFSELLGYSGNQELKNVSFSKIFVDQAVCEKIVQNLQHKGSIQNLDFELIKKDGTTLWVSMSAINKILPNKDNVYVAGLVDISHRKAQEAKVAKLVMELKKLIIIDELTGVYNLRGLKQEGKQELNHALRLKYDIGVIMFDIDHFKKINDTYGHAAGDVALKHLVNTCRSQLRNIDTLGRYGGEEFVIIAPVLDIKSAILVAEKVRKKIESTSVELENVNTKEKSPVNLTVSLGICDLSILSKGQKDLMELVKYSDLALYEAKKTGRNKSVVCTIDHDSGKVILSPAV